MANTLVDLLYEIGGHFVSSLAQFVSSLPNTLVSVLFIFLASYLLSKDSSRIKSHLISVFSETQVILPLRRIWDDLKRTCIGFVQAQIILVSLTMFTVYIGMLLLKVEHPFTIAVIAGLVDLVPYLGTGIIFIPWILYLFLTHHYFLTIGLASLFAAVIIQRQILEPKILSSSAGLDPLASLTALYFGFKWLGLAGLIIGPMILVILKALYQTGTLHAIWLFVLGKKTE